MSAGVRLGFVGWLVWCAAPLAAQTAGDPLVLTHITVIDGTGAAARPDMTVTLTHGRIGSIEPAATASMA